jgi:undecaprenyl-diphosphatase
MDNEQPQLIRRPNTFLALLRGREVLLLIAVLLGLFLLLTGFVLVDNLQPFSWDKSITHEIQEFPSPVGSVLVAISWPGFAPQNFIIPAVFVLFMLWMGWRTEAAFTTLAAMGGLLAEGIKYLIHRPRPTPEFAQILQLLSSPSFPSGHVTSYVVLCGFLFYLAYTLLPRRSPLRWALLILLSAIILLVGPSRIYMGQHWASDALAGYTLGFGYLLVVIELYRLWMHRHPRAKETVSTPPQTTGPSAGTAP